MRFLRLQFRISHLSLFTSAVALGGALVADGAGSTTIAATAAFSGHVAAVATVPREPGAVLKARYRGKRKPGDDEASALFDEGQYEFDSGYPKAAIRVFEALVLRFPGSPHAAKARQYLTRLQAEKTAVTSGPITRASTRAVRPPAQDVERQALTVARTDPTISLSTSSPDEFQRDSGLQLKLLHAVGDRVFFAPSSAALGAKARQALRRQAAWLLRNDAALVEVVGHADEPGSKKKNMKLSRQRAEAVRRRLIQEGINSARIRIVARGRTEQIAPCLSARCSAQNRRVVTRLLRHRTTQSGVRRSAMTRRSKR